MIFQEESWKNIHGKSLHHSVLFNLSLTLGKMPENWKVANISPIFKRRDWENCCNYRPISLLCIVSKVLERAVLNQIKSEILPLITQFQRGFLNGRSIETQLIQVYNHINLMLDSSEQTDIIYLDFSKALSLIISCYTNWDHLDLMGHSITGYVAMLTIESKELSSMRNTRSGAMSFRGFHGDLF